MSRHERTLGQDAHIRIQGRILPTDKPLTDEQINQVREDFVAYIDCHGITRMEIARQLGCSNDLVNKFANSTYKSDCEPMARRLNDWMEQDARARRAELPDVYVSTWIADSLLGLAYNAISAGMMAAAVVPSGCGKSKVLKILAHKTSGHYLYCDEDHTVKGFMVDLTKAIDDKMGTQGSAGQLKRKIVQRLKGTRQPIFLDEAQRLPEAVYSRIRSIHDQAGVSIIMAGTDEILYRIDDQAGGKGQMASRCYRFNAMDSIYNVDGDGDDRSAALLFSEDEIREYLERVHVRIDPDAFQLMHALACIPGRGCLRTVRAVLRLILQRWPGEAVTRDRILWALPIQFGDEGLHMAQLASRVHQWKRRQTAAVRSA